MKKKLTMIISLMFVMATFAACGGGNEEKPEVKEEEQKVEEKEEDKKEEDKVEEKEEDKKEEETTEASGTLTVYSPHPAEAISIGVQEFQDKYGIKVDVVAAGTGELLARIESEASNPLGDVFWGGGAESLQSYADYLEPYAPSGIDGIDPKYYDPQNYWVGESPLPMVILYNTNLVPEELAPTGWEDVLNEEFKGKIAMADPATSGSAYTILLTMVQAFGKDDGKGWEFIEKFYNNLDGKVTSSSSGVYKGVNDGEYALGLTLEKEAIKYVEAGGPVKIVYPKEGTSAVPDGVGLIKGAKNLENAKLFIDFVTDKECQDIMSKEVKRRPVRTDVDAPTGLPAMEEIKLIDYDFNWAAGEKEANLTKWKDIMVNAQ